MIISEQRKIDEALNALMKACGFSGESGTEEMFWVLAEAVGRVIEDWDSVVGASHREGLCYNVNAWLSDEISKSVLEYHKRAAVADAQQAGSA
jgi:hypothetical protein